MVDEESKSDAIKEAREFISIVGNCGLYPDKAQRWISALCDEVEELRRRNATQADSIMEFQEEQKAFNAVANDLLEALVKAVVYAPNVKVAADALRSAITPKGSEK